MREREIPHKYPEAQFEGLSLPVRVYLASNLVLRSLGPQDPARELITGIQLRVLSQIQQDPILQAEFNSYLEHIKKTIPKDE